KQLDFGLYEEETAPNPTCGCLLNVCSFCPAFLLTLDIACPFWRQSPRHCGATSPLDSAHSPACRLCRRKLLAEPSREHPPAPAPHSLVALAPGSLLRVRLPSGSPLSARHQPAGIERRRHSWPRFALRSAAPLAKGPEHGNPKSFSKPRQCRQKKHCCCPL